MFISRRKLESLERRIRTLEEDSKIILYSEAKIPGGMMYYPPQVLASMDLKTIVCRILDHLGLKVQHTPTVYGKTDLVKK